MLVVDRGQGPAVLLLHGSPSAPSDFETLLRELPGRRILVPSLPGYAGSDRLVPYSIPVVRELLERELLSRGIDRVAAVGFSFGAYRAFDLALSGRVQVSPIVALGGVAGFDPEEQQGLLGYSAAVRGPSGFDAPGLRHLFRTLMLSESARSNADWVRKVDGWMDAVSPAALGDEFEAAASAPDLRPRLGELGAPVLAIVGELDQASPLARSRRIASGARDGRLEVIPGVGHALLLEAPARTAELVRAALRG